MGGLSYGHMLTHLDLSAILSRLPEAEVGRLRLSVAEATTRSGIGGRDAWPLYWTRTTACRQGVLQERQLVLLASGGPGPQRQPDPCQWLHAFGPMPQSTGRRNAFRV